MYRPEKSYKISISDNPETSDFSVWFSDDPDELTTFLFQAMGLEQTQKNQREFKASGKKERAFAEIMEVCLPHGEYPIKIPYLPPKLIGQAGITSMFHSIASFVYDDAFGKKQEQDILIFERKSSRRNGYAGVLARTLFNVGKEGFTVSARANKTRAEELFSDDFVQISIREPFGFFDTDLIQEKDISKTDGKEKIKEDVLPETGAINNTGIPPEETIIVDDESDGIITEGTPLKDVSPPAVTDTVHVTPNAEPLDNSEVESKVTDVKPVTPTHVTPVKEVFPLVTVDNKKEERLDENTTSKKIISDDEILKDNYALFRKIASEFKRAFKDGSNFSESKSTESKFKTIYIQRNDEIENDLVDLDFVLIPNTKEEEGNEVIQIRVHLKAKEAIVTSWEVNETQQDYEQSHFSDLVEKLLYDGHLLELWEKKTENNQEPDKLTTKIQDPSEKSPIQSISITKNKSNIDDFQVFSSWVDVNKWIAALTRNTTDLLTIYYSIRWTNNQIIASSFELFSEHFHPQYEEQLLQKAVLFAILHTQYHKEGRFNNLPKQALVKKNSSKDLGKLLEEVDLGKNVEIYKKLFQPKIPLASIDIKSNLIPLMVKTYDKGQEFERTNDLLTANKTSRASEDSVEIKAIWKDGTQLKTSIKLKSVPSQPDSAFWQTLIASFTTDYKPYKYQTADEQALLFTHELKTPRPKFYFKNLLAAYWYSSDAKVKEKIQFLGYAYHRMELSSLIQQFLQELEEEEENALIVSSKSSSRWQLLVNFLIEYKKLEANDTNLQLALITQLIDNAVDVEDEKSKTVLSGLLIKMRAGETLTDLPSKRIHSLLKLQKQHKKAEDKRIEANRKVEQLIDEKGTDVLKYNSDELALLSTYSGYGGSKLSEVNKGLLYEYYTPDDIIRFMWGFAFKHGYSTGAVLEPSCGIGKFLKYAPKTVRVEGYEINKHSAQIAQLLYPKATIYNKSFEQLFFNGNVYLKGKFRTDPFQLVIGNPPYGSFSGKFAGMGEKKRTKAFTYDQYFLTRGLDLLVSGGLLILIIPQSFLDNNTKYMPLKERVASKADFIEARRLPHGIFEHTEVGTDIVVFRKK